MAYRPMTDAEVGVFVRSSPPHTAKLATVRADGRPHVAPVWYDVDDDGLLVITTGASTVKGRNILRDPRVAVSIDDERPPFSFVMIEGTAEPFGDDADLLRWATRIGGRYMGADAADGYGKRNAVPGELLLRIHADRVVSAQDLAD